MADICDMADIQNELALEYAIRDAAKDIPPGVAGDCDLCGEYSGRLIGGACAPCREKYKLP